jgi:four helix bundle protein
MANFRRFEAWQAAHELAVAVYRVTSTWPASERYGLVSQVRRAAFSAPVNIVEGSQRRGSREFRRFLDISLGSLAEVEYTLEFAEAVAVAGPSDCEQLAPLVARAGQLCFGLARSLERPPRAR